MRNPWGKETYWGDWSDESGLWTPGLRQQAGSVVLNDGEFFMSIEDFHKHLKYTFINRNTDDLTRNTFLKLNDRTYSPGKYKRICGN